ncbi:hypothetical protein RHSIM_Rhsim02G0074500 [Rhododendron simsii]|uniref:Uncharacterized protein n=1 Tax=Rhododendron simsii TaxID=118357 RepID=A0A834HBF8_RHOSS|nr:hypothetical protein RHSIM_Rhsim02G0074500 [Rhododendron simsii]
MKQESSDSIPRLLKWNIAKLRKALKDVKQLQQLPDEKVKDGTLEQTIEEKLIMNLSNMRFSKIRFSKALGRKMKSTNMRRRRECLKKLVDNILDDSKMNALAMIDELRKEKDSITNDMTTKIERLENEKKQMEIEKESICEPLNDEIAKLKKLVESQDKQIVMLKDVMRKGPLTMMHELKNQKQSLEKDLIEKVKSLEKEKKQLELQKLKIQEDNDIVLQSKDQQITTFARKIEEIEEEMKNQIQNVDKQNKKLCLVKDRYIQTLLNKANVLERQKAKQQDVNNVLQMQIDEFKIHEVTQHYADETEGIVHQVTQNATLEKIRRLEHEKEELELELLDIRVHEERQKRKVEKSLISPNSNIIALKARERKKNTDADFVYEDLKKKTKTGNELFLDVDDLVES